MSAGSDVRAGSVHGRLDFVDRCANAPLWPSPISARIEVSVHDLDGARRRLGWADARRAAGRSPARSAERDFDDNRRALHALSEQVPAIRTEFVTKETRLREVEQQRAALNDHCGLLTQENDALGTRIEELVVDASKLSRQLSELRGERDELKGLLDELETSYGHETAAHAKLKAAHFDATEAQRLSEADLQEKLSATTTRLEAAEQLLVAARAGMHEQDVTIQKSEQRVLERSLEAKSLEVQVADLQKDLASARAGHVEAEVARTFGVEQSATLTKSLQEKEVALQRAEQKVVAVEARLDEYKKATLGDRALFEEKLAELTERLDAESAARLFAEGALRSARQERTARRQEGRDVPSKSLSAETDRQTARLRGCGVRSCRSDWLTSAESIIGRYNRRTDALKSGSAGRVSSSSTPSTLTA